MQQATSPSQPSAAGVHLTVRVTCLLPGLLDSQCTSIGKNQATVPSGSRSDIPCGCCVTAHVHMMGRIDRRVSIDITLYREQVERTPDSSFSSCILQPSQCNTPSVPSYELIPLQAHEHGSTPYPNDGALLPVPINTAYG